MEVRVIQALNAGFIDYGSERYYNLATCYFSHFIHHI